MNESHPERSGEERAAESIRAERESRPQVARRATTGVVGNDPVLIRTVPAATSNDVYKSGNLVAVSVNCYSAGSFGFVRPPDHLHFAQDDSRLCIIPINFQLRTLVPRMRRGS